jgi:cold shock CspA family protein
MQQTRETGVVITWREFDRFGFLQRDTDPDGEHVFIHLNDIDGDRRLAPGAHVSYELRSGPRGLRGVGVRVEMRNGGHRSVSGVEPRRTASAAGSL